MHRTFTRLRLRPPDLVVTIGTLTLVHYRPIGPEIDVLPAQPAQLARAQPCERRDHDQSASAPVRRGTQDAADLFRGRNVDADLELRRHAPGSAFASPCPSALPIAAMTR